jgi:hypothetical protein
MAGSPAPLAYIIIRWLFRFGRPSPPVAEDCKARIACQWETAECRDATGGDGLPNRNNQRTIAPRCISALCCLPLTRYAGLTVLGVFYSNVVVGGEDARDPIFGDVLLALDHHVRIEDAEDCKARIASPRTTPTL